MGNQCLFFVCVPFPLTLDSLLLTFIRTHSNILSLLGFIMREAFTMVLKRLRHDAGLSQAQVARHLDVSTGLVKRWEGGHDAVPLYRIFDLAELYGVRMDYLVEKLRKHDRPRFQAWKRLDERFRQYYCGGFEGRERRSSCHPAEAGA
jgi:transcriptional regulator with XRE-family HTH domain